jgi:hypothetical protein
MSIAPRTPAECFATLIAWLTRSVGAMSGGDRLSYLLIGQIVERLRGIKQRFVRLAARIGAGRYARRVVTPHRRAAGPRRPNPLPRTYGWLVPLVPDAVAFRAQLEDLFRDPAMVELMQAAPASLARPLRSLCRMLGAPPPPILAPARRAAPLKREPPKRDPPKLDTPPEPPRPQPPAWMPRRTRWTLTRMRGSPKSA